jgi:hypothetical protein
MKKIFTITIKATCILLLVAFGCFAKAQHPNTTHDYQVINQAKWMLLRNDTLDYSLDSYMGSEAIFFKRCVPKRLSV